MINLLNLTTINLRSQFGSFEPVSPLTPTVTNETVVSDAEKIISMGLGLFTTLGGLFLVVNFLIAGITWITSAGDSSKLKKARDTMTQSVIGLVVLIMSYSIIAIIGTALGFEILNLQAQIALILP